MPHLPGKHWLLQGTLLGKMPPPCRAAACEGYRVGLGPSSQCAAPKTLRLPRAIQCVSCAGGWRPPDSFRRRAGHQQDQERTRGVILSALLPTSPEGREAGERSHRWPVSSSILPMSWNRHKIPPHGFTELWVGQRAGCWEGGAGTEMGADPPHLPCDSLHSAAPELCPVSQTESCELF